MAVTGLELVLDEAEGYVFLRSRTGTDDESEKLPHLRLHVGPYRFGSVYCCLCCARGWLNSMPAAASLYWF